MDNNEARQTLDNMLPTGILKIITNEHACGGGQHPDINGFVQDICNAFKFPITDARHFVVHDVISFEDLAKNNLMAAHTSEGDICMGYPIDLLRRLTEASLKT